MTDSEETIVNSAHSTKPTPDTSGSEETIVEATFVTSDEETIAELEPVASHSAHSHGRDESKKDKNKHKRPAPEGETKRGGIVATATGSAIGAATAAAAPHIAHSLNSSQSDETAAPQPQLHTTHSATSSHSTTNDDLIDISPDEIEILGLNDNTIDNQDLTINNISMGNQEYVMVDLDDDDIIEIVPDDNIVEVSVEIDDYSDENDTGENDTDSDDPAAEPLDDDLTAELY